MVVDTISHQSNKPSASTILPLLFEHWEYAYWTLAILKICIVDNVADVLDIEMQIEALQFEWTNHEHQQCCRSCLNIEMHSEPLQFSRYVESTLPLMFEHWDWNWTLAILKICICPWSHMIRDAEGHKCWWAHHLESTLYALLRNRGAKIFIRSRCRGSCVYWTWSPPPHSLLSSSLVISFRASAHPPQNPWLTTYFWIMMHVPIQF